MAMRFNNGVPNLITMNATPFLQLAHLDADLGVYAQDRWTIKRATVSYGLRYDHFASSFPEQRIGPAALVPNRNFCCRRPTASRGTTSRRAHRVRPVRHRQDGAEGLLRQYVAGQALRGNDANVIFGDGLNPAQRDAHAIVE